MNKLDIIAHRGYSGKYGDNNLQSIKKAINIGCNIIEIDIRLTEDQQLVLYHDSEIIIKDNLLEIENTKFQHLSDKVCLLQDILDSTPCEITYYLDVKVKNNAEIIKKKLIRLLEKYNNRHFIIASFDIDFIINYPKSKYTSLGIISESYNSDKLNKYLLNVDYLILDINCIHKIEKNQLIHIESKVIFYLYTVNNSYEIDNYKQFVNGIVTDFPERFLN